MKYILTILTEKGQFDLYRIPDAEMLKFELTKHSHEDGTEWVRKFDNLSDAMDDLNTELRLDIEDE